jgi:PAS domain S-box-containing protein
MIESEFLRLLVEETADALIITAPDGIVLNRSRGLENTFGFAQDEAASQSLYCLVLPAGYSLAAGCDARIVNLINTRKLTDQVESVVENLK